MIRWKLAVVSLLSCVLVGSMQSQTLNAESSRIRSVPAIAAFPSMASIHVGGVQSLTAQISEGADQHVSWNSTGGSITGTGGTVSFTASSPGTYRVTAVSVADPAKSAACLITVTTSPKPSVAHPRLWITTSDLPRLRSWAVTSNPMWQNGLSATLITATTHANQHWSWTFRGGTGSPDNSWQDNGSSVGQLDPTEQYAELFAFASLVSPQISQRATFGKMARDMVMYIVNQADKGYAAGVPFRAPSFAIDDRSRYYGEAFALTVDWAYPYFSPQDKAKVRRVFLLWCRSNVQGGTTTNDHPEPIGLLNRPEIVRDRKAARWAANNYFQAHMRNLVMMSLALDIADDPPLDPLQSRDSFHADGSANSVHAYLANATGAWLYQQYAMFEDREVAGATLHISPTMGLGAEAGGAPPEGWEYGVSIGYMLQALWALHSSGNDDPQIAGKQIAMLTSSYWDLWLGGVFHSTTPRPIVPKDPNYAYLGSLYQPSAYGDVQNLFLYPDYVNVLAALGSMDLANGNERRANAVRWTAANMLPGGVTELYRRVGSTPENAVLYFLLFDPRALVAHDPRPDYSLGYSTPFVRLEARTDWSPNATWFTYKCSWLSIDHQHGDCGQFEWYRKGEWLVKARSGYASDGVAAASDQHNTLTLYNGLARAPRPWQRAIVERGGQMVEGLAAGDPSTIVSATSRTYAAAFSDMTGLYNDPSDGATAISDASRSIVWLKPDTIVTYDRASSRTSGVFKRYNLTLPARPVIRGLAASATTGNGQALDIFTLLPNTAKTQMTTGAADRFNSVANLEPTEYKLRVEDTTNPSVVRFLTVLHAHDNGTPPITPTFATSSSGAAFDGAIMGSAVVMFIRNTADTTKFVSMTYTVPAVVTMHVVIGLTPGAGYAVTSQLTPEVKTITVHTGGKVVADSAGTIAF